MNVKVCGITTMKQLVQLDGLDIDFAGLVFDNKSYQYVENTLKASDVKDADFDIKKVGIFSEGDYEDIMEKVEHYGLDMVQLNGIASPELCRQLSEDTEVIKTFYMNELSRENIDPILQRYDEVCDYYSFDKLINKRAHGMTESFDWDLINDSKIEKPFFMGGSSVRPSDAPLINKFKHPDFFGIDINQQFEAAPGIKDMALVLTFIRALKQVVN